MAGEKWPIEGLQAVEILHVDTAGSQDFYKTHEVNPSEKRQCQAILMDLFQECCKQFDGYVPDNWQGYGGHAFFNPRRESGRSILAAAAFIAQLPLLAQQTATTLGRRKTPDEARRHFRIKAHFGNVYLTADGKCDAGSSEDFDSFLKHERELAPVTDELFITDQLRTELRSSDKSKFELYQGEQAFGSLRTALHRLAARPKVHRRLLHEAGEDPKDITVEEWGTLRRLLRSQSINVAARNQIAEGLIEILADRPDGAAFDHTALAGLTIRALYRYLSAVYPHQNFRVSLWRPTMSLAPAVLDKVMSYPTDPPPVPRTVSMDDTHFQVVQAFHSGTPCITQSIPESRLKGNWVDFDDPRTGSPSSMQSSMQIPIYRSKAGIGNFIQKELLGVISIDADKPDFFLQAESDAWIEDFTGYLANLALAEHMRRSEHRRNTNAPTNPSRRARSRRGQTGAVALAPTKDD